MTPQSADTLGRWFGAARRSVAIKPRRRRNSLTRDRPEEVGLQWTEVDRAVAPALPAADVAALALAGCHLSHSLHRGRALRFVLPDLSELYPQLYQ
ncbi:hypothetical protein SNL152K_3414 [Streptomyces sp. NL15-2K]|nr:hypothetical protein SNL152K_3414 [Streptomyces sp. NL15-2K]